MMYKWVCVLLAFALILNSCVSSSNVPDYGSNAISAGADAGPTSGPVIKVQTGPSYGLYDIALSPDGTRIVSVGEDMSMRVWDVESGMQLRTFNGHAGALSALSISADGRLAITGGSWDNTVRLWDLERGLLLRVMSENKSYHKNWVSAAAISPDGLRAVSGDQDGVVLLWDFRQGTRPPQAMGSLHSPVRDLVFAPDGISFALATEDGAVRTWAGTSFERMTTVAQATGSQASICYSADSQLIAIGYLNGTLKVLEALTGREIQSAKTSGGKINDVAFIPESVELLCACADGSIAQLNWETGAWGANYKDTVTPGEPWNALAVSPDGTLFVAAGQDGIIDVWDLGSKDPKRSIRSAGAMASVQLSPDGTDVLASTWSLAGRWNWRDAGFTPAFRTKTVGIGGQWHVARTIATSADSLLVLAARNDDSEFALWDAARSKKIAMFEGVVGPPQRIALSSDGRWVAAGPDKGPLVIWEAGTSKPRFRLEGVVQATGKNIVFAPDGTTLASTIDKEGVIIWDLSAGKVRTAINPVEHFLASGLSYSHDGTKLLMGGWESAHLYSVDGSWIQSFEAGHPRSTITATTLSRNGAVAFTGGQDWSLCRWDVATGKLTARFKGMGGSVSYLAMSQDGRRLFSSSGDGVLRVWDAGSGEILCSAMIDNSGEYLAWTSEGYYGGSERLARERVYVQDGDVVSSIEQYQELLYRPDLVALKARDGKYPDAIRTSSLPAIIARDGPPPIVEILSPDSGDLESREVTLKFRVQDRGGGIGNVIVFLDGMPVVLSEAGRGLSVVAATDTQQAEAKQGTVMEARVSLRGGETLVEVSASNRAQSIESARASRQFRVPQALASKPRLVLLIVAVQQYRDGALRLAYSTADATAFKDAMQRSGQALYREVVVKQLFDAEATRAGFEDAFDALGSVVESEDVFVLYFAGHGVANEDDGEYYFLPVDFRYRDRSSIAEQGISKKLILESMLKIKAGKTILFFDTCNSGSFLDSPSSRGLSEKTAVDRLKRAIGRVMIVASSSTQVALEGYKGHGVFTWALLQALGGSADGDRNGYVSVKELSVYVENAVPEITYATWGYEQVPQSLLPKEDFPLGQVFEAATP
jgi:WD40 repeat protein